MEAVVGEFEEQQPGHAAHSVRQVAGQSVSLHADRLDVIALAVDDGTVPFWAVRLPVAGARVAPAIVAVEPVGAALSVVEIHPRITLLRCQRARARAVVERLLMSL